MSTTVVHVNDVDLADPGVTYIGRAVPRRGIAASKWRNPYKAAASDRCLAEIRGSQGDYAKLVLGWYRHYVDESPELLAALPELVGQKLACWCKKRGDEPCHGDVLVALLREKGLEP